MRRMQLLSWKLLLFILLYLSGDMYVRLPTPKTTQKILTNQNNNITPIIMCYHHLSVFMCYFEASGKTLYM